MSKKKPFYICTNCDKPSRFLKPRKARFMERGRIKPTIYGRGTPSGYPCYRCAERHYQLEEDWADYNASRF